MRTFTYQQFVFEWGQACDAEWRRLNPDNTNGPALSDVMHGVYGILVESKPVPGQPEPPGPSPLEPLTARGRHLYAGDRPFQIRALSEFDLVHLARIGNVDEVARRMDRAKAANRNVLRVLLMAKNLFDLSPAMPGYIEAQRAVETMAHERGLRVEWVIFADATQVMPSHAERERFLDQILSVLLPVDPVNLVNESRKNWDAKPTDPALLNMVAHVRREGFTCSLSDPSDVVDDPITGEPLRSSLVTLAQHGPILVLHAERKARDQRWAGWVDHLKGFNEVAFDLDRVLYHQEPMGAASVYQDGRRDNRPLAHLAASLVCAVMQMGYCYHYISAQSDARPGLDLCAAAALVPCGPEWTPRNAGTGGACVTKFNGYDKIRSCDNGREAWAVGYGYRGGTVEWAGGWTPQSVGDWEQTVDGQTGRVTLWKATR